MTIDRFGPIRIVYTSFDESREEAFSPAVQLGLILLDRHDDRRLKRVLENVRYIVALELNTVAAAYPPLSACKIDFSRLNLGVGAEQIGAAMAGLIVHEATHLYLERRGIEYTPARRLQIERICRKEERRTMLRLAAAGYGAIDAIPEAANAKEWYEAQNPRRMTRVLSLLRWVRVVRRRSSDTIEREKHADQPAAGHSAAGAPGPEHGA